MCFFFLLPFNGFTSALILKGQGPASFRCLGCLQLDSWAQCEQHPASELRSEKQPHFLSSLSAAVSLKTLQLQLEPLFLFPSLRNKRTFIGRRVQRRSGGWTRRAPAAGRSSIPRRKSAAWTRWELETLEDHNGFIQPVRNSKLDYKALKVYFTSSFLTDN